MGLRPAIFLDRDGVLCANQPNYIKNEAELQLFPWTTLAMRTLAKLDAYIFVITNQSAVGRGLLSLKEAETINNRLKHFIELGGGRIDDIFMCPHAPKDSCACRKPKPLMIYRARFYYPGLDMRKITIIGDQLSDLVELPGYKIKYFLVQSGLTTKPPRGVSFMPTILEVAKWLNVHDSHINAETVSVT